MSKARLIAALIFLMSLTAIATWIVPIRLATEPGASYYNFSFVTDECCYAAHIAPLIDKTNDANVVNGFSDQSFTPQFYLEMLLRRILTVLQMHSITFFWLWRIGYPLFLGITLLLLTIISLRRSDKLWHWPLALMTAAAAWPLFYFAYELLMPRFPMRYWLERIPTNFEVLLMVVLFATIVYLLREPTLRRAIMVVLALAAIVYARPYSIVGCGPPLLITVFWLTYTRFVPWRVSTIAAAVFVILLLPFVLQMHQNSLSPEYKAWTERYFPEVDGYEVHPRWAYHLATAIVLAIMAWRLRGPWRVFVLSLAITAAYVPFASGLRPWRVQLLNIYDRWGTLLSLSLVVGALLLLAQSCETWRGKAGARRVSRALYTLAAVSFLSSGVLAVRSYLYDFSADRNSNHMILNADAQCVPAYTWITNNTASDALFVVDDGLDWGKVDKDPVLRTYAGTIIWDRAELFLLTARRRCVYTERLYVNSISAADLRFARALHYGTFGMTIPVELYKEALKHYRPDYIFWRRTSAVPRGFGAQLQSLATVVYSDQCCEIWKLRYE